MPKSQALLDHMAEEIYDLYKLIAAARSAAPGGPDDLSETEFLALDILLKEGPQTIGEIQKRVGVVPAQMSRIVRALEEQGGKGYVECQINPRDRRRINLSLTRTGQDAHDRYRSIRFRTMIRVLEALEPQDREPFMAMLRKISSAFSIKKNKL